METVIISGIVIEGRSSMGMFAAEKGDAVRAFFVVGVRRESIAASHKSEAI